MLSKCGSEVDLKEAYRSWALRNKVTVGESKDSFVKRMGIDNNTFGYIEAVVKEENSRNNSLVKVAPCGCLKRTQNELKSRTKLNNPLGGWYAEARCFFCKGTGITKTQWNHLNGWDVRNMLKEEQLRKKAS